MEVEEEEPSQLPRTPPTPLTSLELKTSDARTLPRPWSYRNTAGPAPYAIRSHGPQCREPGTALTPAATWAREAMGSSSIEVDGASMSSAVVGMMNGLFWLLFLVLLCSDFLSADKDDDVESSQRVMDCQIKLDRSRTSEY